MTTITMYITILISILIGVLLIYFLVSPNRRTVGSAPSILTSIGIFGTFLGIAIGLMNFDPNNVIAGVPLFLSGIKLAFWSSVIGIFAALIHRIKFSLSPYDDGDAASAESDAVALDSLTQIVENLDRLGDRVEAGMGDMAGGVSKTARELAEELKSDQSVVDMLRELREELARTSDAEQNIIKAQMQRLLDGLKEDALAGEQQSGSLLEVFAGLKDEIESGAKLGRDASKEQMETLFAGLSRAAAGTLGELSDVALFRGSKIGPAFREAEAALALNPGLASAHNLLGNIYQVQNRIEEAEVEYQRAIDCDPGNSQIYFNLGRCRAKFGDLRKAREYYLIALETNPDFAEAHANLGYCYLLEKHFHLSISEITKAHELGFSNARTYLNLSYAYHQKDLIPQALEAACMSYDLDPELARTHAHLVVLYLKSGDIQNARIHAALAESRGIKLKSDILETIKQ